jgi:membrane protease YdiL (CAAX protease family)
MIYDDQNPSGAAPVRARASEPSGGYSESKGVPAPAVESFASESQNFSGIPPAPQFRAQISDDLQVPWGWHEVVLFLALGAIASFVLTQVTAQAAIHFFGVSPDDVFGKTMNTPKSLVVLISQAAWDAGAILYFYLMVVSRTAAPFWRTIGWRRFGSRPGLFRASAQQFLIGGAVLGLVVALVSAFLNSKENLPIEELLKARVSMLLFAALGVLVAPLVEETIFRGFLYPIIARRAGITAGIIITGILFGSLHAVQLWGGWGQIALLMLVGIVLTWVRARTGTVTASYFVHLGYNGLQLFGYVLYLVGGLHR